MIRNSSKGRVSLVKLEGQSGQGQGTTGGIGGTIWTGTGGAQERVVWGKTVTSQTCHSPFPGGPSQVAPIPLISDTNQEAVHSARRKLRV